MLKAKLLAGGGAETIYVDDVFSAYTYTGNGSTQTITNGIDLAGKGGMVWSKSRGSVGAGELRDSARGTAILQSSTTGAQVVAASDVTAFNSNGYNLDFVSGTANQGSTTFVGWTFRKATKFFDVVTWTGNSTPRTITHSLGSAPGMIMVKKTNAADSWYVYHRSLGNGGVLYLEQTAAAGIGSSYWNSTDPTASVFSVGGNTGVNGTGNTYVAYLFAHDTGTDGLIQCGSYTTDGSGVGSATLGWEAQYVLAKKSSSTGGWYVFDTMRNFIAAAGSSSALAANSAAAESVLGGFAPTATGFADGGALGASSTFIYLAIRRSNKPPTVGTQVYNAIARTGTGAAATVTGVGFAPDLVAAMNRSGVAGNGFSWFDRLRGPLLRITSKDTTIEGSAAGTLTSFGMDGVSVGADGAEYINSSRESSIINHFFKRAPGVFDQVCWTGDNTTNRSIPHQLSASPELVIWKNRTSALNWAAYSSSLLTTDRLYLNLADAVLSTSALLTSVSSSDIVAASASGYVNASGSTYVAYLFATKAGISKCGSYTGNGGTAGSAGTSQTIDCGFTTGSRFVMLKCTSHTSDWVCVDTVRGLVAGNDPALSLNTTAAEVTTTDVLDPDTSGFIVNQLAAGTTSADFNVTGRTYLYLSFA